MQIEYESTGSFTKTMSYLEKLNRQDYLAELEALGEKGVKALAEGTPKRTGETAASWSYEVQYSSGVTTITWKNSKRTATGDVLVIMLQYGHGTGTGGYVQGRDFINPAIKPIFDEIERKIWDHIREA